MSKQKFLASSVFPAIALVSMSFGLAACERVEPASDSRVVFQAAGTVGAQDAVLLMRVGASGLAVEALEKDTRRVLFSGVLPGQQIQEIMGEIRGPLESSLTGSTLRVLQRGRAERSVVSLGGPAAGDATEGSFQFEGARWISYNTGLLERGFEGRVRLVLKRADGAEVAQFDGLTSRPAAQLRRDLRDSPNVERRAVATDVTGEVTGAFSLGGGLFGGGFHARMVMAVPNGAVRGEQNSYKKVCVFDPKKDLAPAGGAGEIVMNTSGPAYVEATDSFQARIDNIKCNDPDDGQAASGSSDLRYNVTLAVTPDKVLVVGSNQMAASISTADGRKAEFKGANPRIQSELAW